MILAAAADTVVGRGPRFHINDARSALQIARSAQKDWRAASVEQRDFFLWLLLFRPRA